MAELVGFPHISQLSVVTPDGQASTNGQFDCVPASILMGVMYLLGIKTLTPEYNPEALKDAEYGKNWTNRGTDAAAYIPWCTSHGIKLSSVPTASYADAVARAHQFLAQGIPVVFTQQDDYAPLAFRNEWTHVCVWYKDTGNTLTCLDPYIDAPLTYTDAEWSQRLRSTELWILEKTATATAKETTAVATPISLSTPRVSDFYEPAGAMWRCKYAYDARTKKMVPSPNGALVGNAILHYYCSHGNSAYNGLTDLGLPITPEVAVAQNITAQVFERGIVMYDTAHRVDGPIGAGGVYLLNLCSKLAQAILQRVFTLVDAATVQTLQSDRETLTQQVTSLLAQMKDLEQKASKSPDAQTQAQLAEALSRLSQIEELAKR